MNGQTDYQSYIRTQPALSQPLHDNNNDNNNDDDIEDTNENNNNNNSSSIIKHRTNTVGSSPKKYQVITQDIREKFIEKVMSKQITIKEAAREFGLKFSTSKAILQTYKKEGRIGKKKTRQRKPKNNGNNGNNLYNNNNTMLIGHASSNNSNVNSYLMAQQQQQQQMSVGNGNGNNSCDKYGRRNGMVVDRQFPKEQTPQQQQQQLVPLVGQQQQQFQNNQSLQQQQSQYQQQQQSYQPAQMYYFQPQIQQASIQLEQWQPQNVFEQQQQKQLAQQGQLQNYLQNFSNDNQKNINSMNLGNIAKPAQQQQLQQQQQREQKQQMNGNINNNHFNSSNQPRWEIPPQLNQHMQFPQPQQQQQQQLQQNSQQLLQQQPPQSQKVFLPFNQHAQPKQPQISLLPQQYQLQATMYPQQQQLQQQQQQPSQQCEPAGIAKSTQILSSNNSNSTKNTSNIIDHPHPQIPNSNHATQQFFEQQQQQKQQQQQSPSVYPQPIQPHNNAFPISSPLFQSQPQASPFQSLLSYPSLQQQNQLGATVTPQPFNPIDLSNFLERGSFENCYTSPLFMNSIEDQSNINNTNKFINPSIYGMLNHNQQKQGMANNSTTPASLQQPLNHHTNTNLRSINNNDTTTANTDPVPVVAASNPTKNESTTINSNNSNKTHQVYPDPSTESQVNPNSLQAYHYPQPSAFCSSFASNQNTFQQGQVSSFNVDNLNSKNNSFQLGSGFVYNPNTFTFSPAVDSIVGSSSIFSQQCNNIRASSNGLMGRMEQGQQQQQSVEEEQPKIELEGQNQLKMKIPDDAGSQDYKGQLLATKNKEVSENKDSTETQSKSNNHKDQKNHEKSNINQSPANVSTTNATTATSTTLQSSLLPPPSEFVKSIDEKSSLAVRCSSGDRKESEESLLIPSSRSTASSRMCNKQSLINEFAEMQVLGQFKRHNYTHSFPMTNINTTTNQQQLPQQQESSATVLAGGNSSSNMTSSRPSNINSFNISSNGQFGNPSIDQTTTSIETLNQQFLSNNGNLLNGGASAVQGVITTNNNNNNPKSSMNFCSLFNNSNNQNSLDYQAAYQLSQRLSTDSLNFALFNGRSCSNNNNNNTNTSNNTVSAVTTPSVNYGFPSIDLTQQYPYQFNSKQSHTFTPASSLQFNQPSIHFNTQQSASSSMSPQQMQAMTPPTNTSTQNHVSHFAPQNNNNNNNSQTTN